jgi:hypothetical protein
VATRATAHATPLSRDCRGPDTNFERGKKLLVNFALTQSGMVESARRAVLEAAADSQQTMRRTMRKAG